MVTLVTLQEKTERAFRARAAGFVSLNACAPPDVSVNAPYIRMPLVRSRTKKQKQRIVTARDGNSYEIQKTVAPNEELR